MLFPVTWCGRMCELKLLKYTAHSSILLAIASAKSVCLLQKSWKHIKSDTCTEDPTCNAEPPIRATSPGAVLSCRTSNSRNSASFFPKKLMFFFLFNLGRSADSIAPIPSSPDQNPEDHGFVNESGFAGVLNHQLLELFKFVGPVQRTLGLKKKSGGT